VPPWRVAGLLYFLLDANKELGLKVNAEKTKYMLMSSPDSGK
jgi:hypothetical protein